MLWRIISLSGLVFGLGFIPGSSVFGSPQIIDSLRNQLPYIASDTNKVWMLRDIAYYFQSEKPDSAIIFARRGYNLARTLNFTSGQIWNLYQEGLGHEFLNQTDSAVKIYHYAIEIALKSDDNLSRAKLFNSLGVAHYYDGNFTDAIQFYSRGFALSDSIGYSEGKAHALNNLGVIYRKQRRFDRALEIYKRSLDIKETERDTHGMIISYYNIGLSHSYLGEHRLSLDNFLKAMELAGAVSQMGWDQSHIKIGLGVAYYNLEDFDLAGKYLSEGIETISNTNSIEYISALAYQGAIQIREGNIAAGMANLERSWEMASQTGHRVLLRDVLKERALAAETAGHPEIATESWRKFAELNEEINSEAQNWAIEEMNARFELQDKEMTIALQNMELEKEKARNNLYLISGSFSLLLFFVSITFLYFFWRQKKELQVAVHQKEEALAKNDLLFREMHHRTKNNLQLLNSLLSLQERKSQSVLVQQALQSSKDSVGAISLLHHRLYRNEDFRAVDMKPYLMDLSNYFRGAFGLDERGVRLRCECDDIKLDTNLAIPIGLIVNELVTNSIKHAFLNTSAGSIEILLNKTPHNTLLIGVADNGSGLNNIDMPSNGTGNDLIQIFSQRFNAKLTYTGTNPGTRVEFEMPMED